MQHDLISVIVPVYKVEMYLDRCIESIVNQTYKNLEIIIVNDGSPDNCPQLCDDWALKDNRIRVLHQKNSGAGVARNKGLMMCNGQFVSFVDSDDFIHEEFYEHLFSSFTKDVDIVECEYVEFTSDIPTMEISNNIVLDEYDAENALSKHISDTLFKQVIWNKLYKRHIIEGIFFPEGKLIDDEYWTYQTIGKAKKLIHSNQKLYAYRQQSNSVMHRGYSISRLDALDARKKRIDYISENYPNLLAKAKYDFINSCMYQGQMAEKYCDPKERDKIIAILEAYLLKMRLSKDEKREMKTKSRMWYTLANLSISVTCKIRNLLNIGL